MAREEDRRIAKNSLMLLMMNIAKMVFPLLTLPYLTRVLTTDGYGTVVYVKSVMTYMQLMVDFGFLLSATKSIVNAAGNRETCGRVVGNVVAAKISLSVVSFLVLIGLTAALPILRRHAAYTLLSFVPVFLTIFLLDFLFRGLEKMEVITFRFVIMRGVSMVLTFFVIHSDADLLLMPVLDIIGTLLAIGLVALEVRKLNLHISVSGPAEIWGELKQSAVYFASSMASTSFNALNTLLLGIMLTTQEVAYWGVCMQAVAAIQAVYTPITDSLYPVMIKKKEIRLITRMVKLFLPLIAVGCVLAWFLAEFGLTLIGGHQYTAAAPVFRRLIPVLFISFFSLLFGWPTLGAIDKNAQTSKTTVGSVLFQIAGLALLILSGTYTLITVAILRSCTELVLFLLRFRYFCMYRHEFVDYRRKPNAKDY